jgi:3-oxoacyl-[acyl-carrier protein] reductase
MTMKNEIALVTGGTRGIGFAVSKVLAAAGAKVMITARSGVDEAASALGEGVAGCVCDAADYSQAEAAVAETRRRFGRVSILVNNAGIIEPIETIAESDPAAWAHNIQVNLVGAYNAVRATLPDMIEAGAGTIVNVSSGAAHRPLDGWSAYCSGKAGLAMLTRAIHLEAHGQGVRTFGFAPGTVDTEMQGKIRASGVNMISQIPREKLGGVENPARVIAYLCGSAASDLAGEELSISDEKLRLRAGLPAS